MKQAGRRKELITLQTWLAEIAAGRSLPPKRYKKLRDQSAEDEWTEYELRVGRMRVYLFHYPPRYRVIVLGEIKKSDKQQRKSIKHLRNVKEQYRQSLLKKPPQ